MSSPSQKYIYVICEGDNAATVKIGFSANPERRVKQLQTGHADALEVYYKQEVDADKVRGLERVVHKLLSHRKRKGEWFSLSPSDAVLEIKHAVMRYGDIDDLTTRLNRGTVSYL